MVAIDSTFLGLMLYPGARACEDPATNKPTTHIAERIQKLLEDLDTAQERIVVPTPALCEFLVLAGADGSIYLGDMHQKRTLLVKPFDEMAAIELASMEIEARRRGGKRKPVRDDVPWQKVKFDRQIVAIAKIHKAHTVYSDDAHVRTIAEDIGIRVVSCWELSIPPSNTPLLDTTEPPLDIR
jgi:hypothetical protein